MSQVPVPTARNAAESRGARVKGATENTMMQLFRRSYMFRPGFLKPTPGQQNIPRYYKLLAWLYFVGRALYPAGFCTLQELGGAMVNAAITCYPKQIVEVKDIVRLAAMDATHLPPLVHPKA